MLVIVMVQRHPSLVGPLVAFLLQTTSLCLKIPRKLALREEAFMSVRAQGTLGPVSEGHNVFSSRDLPSTSRGQKQ